MTTLTEDMAGALRAIVASDTEARSQGGLLRYGLLDCEDNHGSLYRSQGLDNAIEKARAVLASFDAEGDGETFQQRVQLWMMACFGPEIAADKLERCDRFIEEALELVQAGEYTKERAHALVDYVFDRPQGEINQEVGGVMVTLAAHCLAYGVDMHSAGETELARIWTKVEQIRAKHAAKPKGSALPIVPPAGGAG
jgi:hypothetical protein